MKVCSVCKQSKPYTQFHKKSASKDGYRSWCKECRTVRDDKEAAKLRAKKWYYSNWLRARETRIAYVESHKEATNESKYKWRKNNKEKAAAHWAISNALRQGKMTKKPCEVCNSENTHAHHYDYSKQLEVYWLCAFHHSQIHKELRWQKQ